MFTDVKQLALSGLYFRDLLHCLLQTVKALCLVEFKSYKTESLKHHSAFFFFHVKGHKLYRLGTT